MKSTSIDRPAHLRIDRAEAMAAFGSYLDHLDDFDLLGASGPRYRLLRLGFAVRWEPARRLDPESGQLDVSCETMKKENRPVIASDRAAQ